MPLQSCAKRRVGCALGSAAMHADAKQPDFCTYLSAVLLGGLVAERAESNPVSAEEVLERMLKMFAN